MYLIFENSITQPSWEIGKLPFDEVNSKTNLFWRFQKYQALILILVQKSDFADPNLQTLAFEIAVTNSQQKFSAL